MAQKCRLRVPDQSGFGRSDKPLLDYSIQTYVDFLNEFLRQLKVEKASLVGESLGGGIAGLYVAEIGGGAHLIPVEKLVLVEAAGAGHDHPISLFPHHSSPCTRRPSEPRLHHPSPS